VSTTRDGVDCLQEILLVVDGKVIMVVIYAAAAAGSQSETGAPHTCIILAEMEIKVTWTP